MTKGQLYGFFRGAGAAAVAAVFGSGLFFRCANVTSTMEGGPRDSLPPRVVRMTPAYNATGIRPEKIVIEFDEMIQLKEMQAEFFTSPQMEVKPTVSFKRNQAIVTIDSPLADTTTYMLNLGSGVVDNNEGNPLHGLKYTFSTGPYIDSMYMSGYVSDALTADTMKGADIFFYDARLDTVPGQDSLLFDTRRASAITRTLTDGGFVYPNLKPIDYRLYALVDNNGNAMYDPGTDGVAFLDSVQNPTRLPSFSMWYDSTRMHMVAQPQLFFRTFVEEVARPQNLAASSRPAAGQIILDFADRDPKIERFELNGIPSDKILTEYLKPTRDSIRYWIDMLPAELPDTLRGTIAYERPDSLGQNYTHEQELRLVFVDPERAKARADSLAAAQKALEPVRPPTRRQLRRAERAAARALADSLAAAARDSLAALAVDSLAADSLAIGADSLAAKPDSIPEPKVKYSLEGAEPVIPGIPPAIVFELPLRRAATDSMRLLRTEADSTETAVDFRWVRDSLNIRRYSLESEWTDGTAYRLVIPPGALEAIDGERNDSLSQVFTVGKQTDLGSITLHLVRPPADYRYIVQVMDENGQQTIREAAHLEPGTREIGYLAKGRVRLRLIEDRNRNGRWDTGRLITRVQPEQIAWYRPADSLSFDLQGAAELDSIDLTALFAPRVLRETPPDSLDGAAEIDMPVGKDIVTPAADQPYQTSEARVEGFELTDPRAVRRAEKAARREARAAEKAARRGGELAPPDPHEEHDEGHEH